MSKKIQSAMDIARRMAGGRVGYAEGGAPESTPSRIQSFLESLSSRAHQGIDSSVADLEAAGAHPKAGPFMARTAVDTVLGIPISLLKAYNDPTIPNVTDAGIQTAAGLGRVRAAGKIALAGLGAAGAKDLGLFDIAANAQALEGLTPAQNKELEDLKAVNKAYKWKNDRDREQGQARIKQLEDIANEDAKIRNRLKAEAAARGETDKQEEYTRAVKRAESAKSSEMARDKRFSDTDIGKLYEKYGIATPALMAIGAGALSKAAGAPSFKMPMAVGAGTGAVGANWPLMYNSYFTEPDNPQRLAYEAYARELPDTHPEKQKWSDYASTLPKGNPLREVASKELYDPVKLAERSGIGAVEGVLGGLAGAELTKLPGRGLEFMGSMPGRFRAGVNAGNAQAEAAKLKGAQSLQGAGREAGSGERLAREAAELEAGAMPRFEGSPPAPRAFDPMSSPAAASPGPAPSLQPTPAALPNPPMTFPNSDIPLPPGVKLRSDGVAYNIHTGHPVKKQLYTPKGEEVAKPKGKKSEKSKLSEPTDVNDVPLKVDKLPDDPSLLTRGMNRGGVVASALRIARAMGGRVHTGPILQRADGGRTDTVPMDVPSGSYVIPADIVSALGEGDTGAGMKAVDGMFGPHAEGNGKDAVPIIAAGGEYVLSPTQVARIAGGDLNKAHAMLDQWVKSTRAKHIETLANLPGPER